MAKKRTPVKSGVAHLLHEVRERIDTMKDDCAEMISEDLANEEDGQRFEKIKQRIEQCKAAVASLHDILDWCEDAVPEGED